MHTVLMKIPCFFFDLYLQGWKQRINLATKYCLFVVVFFIFQHKTFKKLWFIFQIFLFLTSFYSHHTWFCLLYIFFVPLTFVDQNRKIPSSFCLHNHPTLKRQFFCCYSLVKKAFYFVTWGIKPFFNIFWSILKSSKW